MKERVAGILLGLAAGDRIGGPIRMAVRLAESLLERGQVDVGDVAARYLDWWHEGAFDTGPTAARVLTLVDSGLTFDQASWQVHVETGEHTAGCNPAHRSAPLAMLLNLTTQQLADLAAAEARLTHRHPLAADVAVATVLMCSRLVSGESWSAAIAAASAGRLPETRAAMANPGRESLNSGGFAPDVLAAALHFVGNSDSFAAALATSLQFAGSANYCPVLVGSIGGARWGANSISNEMLDHCDILTRLRAVATGLASRWT